MIRVFSLGAGAYRSFKLMKRSIDKKSGKPVSQRYHFIEDDEESVLMFWSIFGVITFIQEYMESKYNTKIKRFVADILEFDISI